MSKPFRTILSLVNLSHTPGRTVLSSVLRFADTRGNWRVKNIQVLEHSPDELVRMIEGEPLDGILSCEMEIPAVAAALERSTIPLVVIGTRRQCIPKRRRSIAFITCDEAQIGAFGADHLMHTGPFASYAFIHYDLSRTPYPYLTMLRRKGFRNQLIKHGIRSSSFGDIIRNSADEDALALESWLSSLPKPCGILLASDTRAANVVSACNRAGIRIPNDVSLLGINNDDYLCLSVTPTLTSIRTNIDSCAYEAAKQLDRMMRARNKPNTPVRILLPAHCEVVVRESCRTASSGASLVARAKSFIAEHARENITVRDVVAHLGVSRRLADLRFRDANGGHTILDEITKVRLNEVAKLLRSDTMPIEQVTRDCGFTNPTYLKTLFKRKFGLTMRDYRARNQPRQGIGTAR